MKYWIIVLVSIVVYGVSVYGAWWYRGTVDEKDFAARIAYAPATYDSSTTETETPQPPQHHQGTAPARMTTNERAEADTAHDRALAVSLDSSRARNAYMSAHVDTTIGNDSTGSVHIQYDPPTRMLIGDFHRPPIKTIEKIIVKTVTVPIIEHDSFMTRTAIFLAGSATYGIIYLFTR